MTYRYMFMTILVAFSNLHGNAAVNHTLNMLVAYGGMHRPPLGLAFYEVPPKKPLSAKQLCITSWPQPTVHGWFLRNEKGKPHLENLINELMNVSASYKWSEETIFYPNVWCPRDVYPMLINGRAIVGINETDDGSGYHVAYQDDDETEVKVLYHKLKGIKFDEALADLLFCNLTELILVKHKLRSRQLGKVLIASYYNEVHYVDEYGASIHSRNFITKHVAVLCKHADIGSLCATTTNGLYRNNFTNQLICVECKPGLFGQNCQFDADECSEVGSVEINHWHSDCWEPSLAGHFNAVTTIQHGGNACGEDSSCVNTFGSYYCACKKGWKGTYCTEDVDECANVPCKYNGSCHNTPGSYVCACLIGYSGIDCKDAIPCASGPCKNGALCLEKDNGFTCLCKANYTGTLCETVIKNEGEKQKEEEEQKFPKGALYGGIAAVCVCLLLFILWLLRRVVKRSVADGKSKSKDRKKSTDRTTSRDQRMTSKADTTTARKKSATAGKMKPKKASPLHDYVVPDMFR